MPSVQLRCGVELYYERWGGGPPLLLISPSNTRIEELRFQLRGCRLLDSFQVLVYDQRGFGMSSMPNSQWPAPEMKLLADDTMELMRAVGWSSANVLGISFGGMVAQELLLHYPDAVERLLLVCSSSGCAPTEADTTASSVELSYPLHQLYSLPDEERIERTMLLADTRRTLDWVDAVEGQAALQYLKQGEQRILSDRAAAKGREWLLLARAAHNTTAGLRRMYCVAPSDGNRSPAEEAELLGPEGLSRDLARPSRGLTVLPSVAVIAAVHDGISPPTASALLREVLGSCPFLWFDTGHWPVLPGEKRSRFDQACLAFFRLGELPVGLLVESKQIEATLDFDKQRRVDCTDILPCAIL